MKQITSEQSGKLENILKLLDGVHSEPEVDNYYHDKIYAILREQHKEEIVKAALIKHYKPQELKIYQAELIKMQAIWNGPVKSWLSFLMTVMLPAKEEHKIPPPQTPKFIAQVSPSLY